MFTADQRIGPYVLVKKLGKGGFGEVWLAEKRTELVTKKVAIKLPLEEQINLDGIKQEATLWEQASGHPNVLPIIDADIYDGQVVIVSEYADGGSLHEWLKARNGKAPSIEKAVELMLGILSGLIHLHSHKITHRDLKPNNILLLGETPRITDFGVSRVVEHNSRGTEALGTPIYMSPEAFQKSMSAKTDIWSAGVVFNEMLSGTYPFYDDDVFVLMDSIRKEDPKPLPDEVPNYLREFVGRSLEKDPDKRFQSASEMRSALMAFSAKGGPKHLSEVVVVSPAATKPGSNMLNRQFFETTTLSYGQGSTGDPSIRTQSRVPERRRPVAWLAIPLVLLIGIGGSAFWWSRSDTGKLDQNVQNSKNAATNGTAAIPAASPAPANSISDPSETISTPPQVPLKEQLNRRTTKSRPAPVTEKPKPAPKSKKALTFTDLVKD